MNPCSWEERVVAGVRNHPLDAESLEHLKGCEQCQQAAFIARILIEEGQEAERTAWARLPTADSVLARAALFVPIAAKQSHTAALKALLPVVWVERFATAIGLVMLVGLSVWTLLRMGTTRVGTAIVHDTVQSLTSQPATDPASGMLYLAGLVVMAFVGLGLRGLVLPQR